MHLRRIAEVHLMRNRAGIEIAAYPAHAADRVDNAVSIQAANTKKLDSYTTLDLGLRYRMRLNADQNEMIWRVGVTNVTNEKYWSGIDDTGTYLFEGDPRTVRVSMSYDF